MELFLPVYLPYKLFSLKMFSVELNMTSCRTGNWIEERPAVGKLAEFKSLCDKCYSEI
jgi:hypothetical protein